MSGRTPLDRVLWAMAMQDTDKERPCVIVADRYCLDDGGCVRVTCMCGARLLLPIGERRCGSCGQRYSVEEREGQATPAQLGAAGAA